MAGGFIILLTKGIKATVPARRAMRFTLKQAVPIAAAGGKGTALKGLAYNTHREFADMSAEVLDVDGWHGLVKSLNCTRCFHVLEGSGLFIVAGREFDVAQGDVVFVPHNTPHDFNGAMRLFVVHSPAKRPELVVPLE
jgi:mannose-6-phosphate isomerase-like protein (cupin superfamily)